MGGNDIDIGESEPCCLGLGLCVLRADFLRQLADGEGGVGGGGGLSHLALDFSHAAES